MIMEYADAGDLYQRILEYQKKGRYMSESFIWTAAVQMTKGLKALHDLNISHRDLKSANVFLYSDGSVKLGDFNVSKIAKNGILFTQTGTPYYASPEVWRDQPYSSKSDIWSMGCVLYEAIALAPPFRAEDMQGLFQKVVKGDVQRIPRNFSNELNTFVARLLTVEAEARPTCEEVLGMQAISKRLFSLSSTNSSPSSPLLDTILLPKNIKQISDRLPASKYDQDKLPSEADEPITTLPMINLHGKVRGRAGLTPDEKMFLSRPGDGDRRKRDYSDPVKSGSPSLYHKKILRENYGGLQIVRKNRLSAFSRPSQSRNLDISALLDNPSPEPSTKVPKLRYMSSHVRPIAKLPMFEGQNSKLLRMISEEESRSQKNLSVKSSLRPLP